MDYQALLARSEDWLKYAIERHLGSKTPPETEPLRQATLADERIRGYLKDVENFHDTRISSHKNPALPAQKLLFLLELGLDTSVPEIDAAIGGILAHKDENGVYRSLVNVPTHFGGTGTDVFCWCLCDAPWLLKALVLANADYETDIRPGVTALAGLCRENGFPCAASPELGAFRGPGRRDDCCPYATLIMADLLSLLPEYRDSDAAKTAAEALMSLWENSYTQHPFLFYTGKDFRKLKAPSAWYDVVSVAGVLSRFPWAREDPRLLEMVDLIRSRQDGEGFFTPESIYLKMKGWDFGQKKEPSPYLTYLCMRILERME